MQPPFILDVVATYERGLDNPDALTLEERLIYLLLEIENLAAMEGWDHFFIYDYGRYFGEVKDGLRAVRDVDSLAILEDYERQLLQQGAASMEPDDVHAFLRQQNDAYFESDRDWREEYDSLTESRWLKVKEYLRSKGMELSNAPV